MGLVHSGTAIQHRVARPRLRLPEPDAIFDSLLPATYSCRPSDKGHFTQQMLRLWSELDSLALDLQPGPVNSIMDAYVSTRAVAAGRSYTLGERAYFTLDGLAEAAGEEPSAVRQLADRLLEQGVLSSGLILTCPRCRSTAWYPSDSVGQTFSCARCSVETHVTSEVWKPRAANERGTFYGLAEVVYQALRNGGRLPILTLKALKDGAASLIFSPEMAIWRQDEAMPVMEVDVWAIEDGRILLGEVRSVDQARRHRAHAKLTGDDCNKLALAAVLATADEVLLATNAIAFSKASVRGLRTALLRAAGDGCAPSVRVIEGLGS
jgi:hypothetical protein